MKLKKILLTVLSAVLLVAISVGATVAYLTDTTGVVKNTFTVGNVSFKDLNDGLDEADVNEYGVIDSENRVITNKYKLIPGHEYTKDPTVHMAADSEDAWLFVKVVNPISDIEDSYSATVTSDGVAVTVNGNIAAQMAALGWEAVKGETNVYAYKTKVNAEDDIVVFAGFALSDDAVVDVDANEDNIADYTTEAYNITIEAYAVQADGFDTALEAWEATYGAEND